MSYFKKHFSKSFLVIVSILLIFYISTVDFHLVYLQLLPVGWYFLLILGVTCCAYLIATKAWQMCFVATPPNQIPLLKLFVIRQIGEALTLINPTNIVGGELSKVALLYHEGINRSDAGLSIIVSRGLIIISFFIIAFLAIGQHILLNSNSNNVLMLIMLLLGLLAIMIFLSRVMLSRRLLLLRVLQFFSWPIPSWRWKYKLLIQVRKLNKLLSDFFRNRRKAAISVLLLSLFHWVAGTLEFYYILHAFEIDITFYDAILLETGVMVFKSIGGFIPGQLGVEEYGNKVMLGMLGIEGLEIWVAVSILRRARQLFWVGLSFFFLFHFYKNVKWKSSS